MNLRLTAMALAAALPARAQIRWWHAVGGALGDWVNDLARGFTVLLAVGTRRHVTPRADGSTTSTRPPASAGRRRP